LAGIQYLDELFSALRDTAEQLTIADTWISRADAAPPATWRMSFLKAARTALSSARSKLDEATTQLAALGPREKLPSLLAGMPERLDDLQKRLETTEKRLSSAWETILPTARGQA